MPGRRSGRLCYEADPDERIVFRVRKVAVLEVASPTSEQDKIPEPIVGQPKWGAPQRPYAWCLERQCRIGRLTRGVGYGGHARAGAGRLAVGCAATSAV